MVYVASRWGEPSQTFVRREAAAVLDAGIAISAASIKAPEPCDPRVDVLHLTHAQVVLYALLATVRHPVRMARLVGTVVCKGAPRNIPAELGAVAVGAAGAGSGRLGPGHLHAHFGWVAAIAAWSAARLDDRTFSVSLHAFEIHDRRYVDGFTPVPLRAALAVFTESHRDQQIVDDRWGVRPVVTRLGVPLSWLEAPSEPRDQELIVTVGRLTEKKGYPVLLRALARTTHPWRCRIIGEGPMRPELTRLIAELDLGDRVTLCGALPEDEVRRELRRAAVSSLASIETPDGDRDGTPMALIEAMASGAVVVATETGSIAELVGAAGVVVAAGDEQALADGLDRLADSAERTSLARAARARIEREWTAPRTAELVIESVGLGS
jgi:glycosyltransferase involved in cell wall biosynthesis